MQGKKSFILYADLIHTVTKMPDEKAGQLLKIILEYVNDNDPSTDDLLLQIAFEPIKQQLKRDLVNWREFRNKQSENGKKGGRPPKINPKKDNPKNPSLLIETQKSLNVTANVNVNESEYTPPREKLQPFKETITQETSLKSITIESDSWIKGMMSEYNLTKEQVIEKASKMITQYQLSGTIEKWGHQAVKGYMVKDWNKIQTTNPTTKKLRTIE